MNESAALPTPFLVSDAPQSLDPRVVKAWRLRRWITTLVLGAALGVAALVVGFKEPEARPWAAGVWVGWIVVRLVWGVFYTRRSYRHWSYRLDGQVLEIAHGVWWKTAQLLPLSRLQHADIQRGPIERRYGLASLVLYTAGTQGAVLIIPGLDADAAVVLRDHLVTIGGDDGV